MNNPQRAINKKKIFLQARVVNTLFAHLILKYKCFSIHGRFFKCTIAIKTQKYRE